MLYYVSGAYVNLLMFAPGVANNTVGGQPHFIVPPKIKDDERGYEI